MLRLAAANFTDARLRRHVLHLLRSHAMKGAAPVPLRLLEDRAPAKRPEEPASRKEGRRSSNVCEAMFPEGCVCQRAGGMQITPGAAASV